MKARNVGAYINGLFGGIASVTAAGTGDATEVDSGFQSVKGYQTVAVVISYKAVLAQDETLSIAANVQDASDASGTGAADWGASLANAVVATGGTGGSTEYGSVVLDIDLLGGTQAGADGTCADEFLQCQWTPDLSASGTDTAEISAVMVVAGADEDPAN